LIFLKKSILRLYISKKKAAIAIGDYEKVVYGSGFIYDQIGKYKFRISANSFFQTNTKQAEKLYQKGQYEKAIEKYKEYLSSNPHGNMAAIAQYYIAKSYVALNKSLEAREEFQKVIDRYPKADWASFSKTQLENLDPVKKA